jgi:hypothetical protein
MKKSVAWWAQRASAVLMPPDWSMVFPFSIPWHIMPRMREENRIVCPIPYLGYCVYERCNFWDEEAQE